MLSLSLPDNSSLCRWTNPLQQDQANCINSTAVPERKNNPKVRHGNHSGARYHFIITVDVQVTLICSTSTASPVHIPWQDFSSVNNLNPFLQLQSKLPTVFLQKWSQPPLLDWHSSISVTKKCFSKQTRHIPHTSAARSRKVTSNWLETPRNKMWWDYHKF